MSEWRLQAESVAGVLASTSTSYESVQSAVTDAHLQSAFQGLQWAPEITGCVSQALNEVLTEQQTVNLAAIHQHINAGIAGVGNAAVQLQFGNSDMAATFQSAMFSAAETGDFTYFEQNGYQP